MFKLVCYISEWVEPFQSSDSSVEFRNHKVRESSDLYHSFLLANQAQKNPNRPNAVYLVTDRVEPSVGLLIRNSLLHECKSQLEKCVKSGTLTDAATPIGELVTRCEDFDDYLAKDRLDEDKEASFFSVVTEKLTPISLALSTFALFLWWNVSSQSASDLDGTQSKDDAIELVKELRLEFEDGNARLNDGQSATVLRLEGISKDIEGLKEKNAEVQLGNDAALDELRAELVSLTGIASNPGEFASCSLDNKKVSVPVIQKWLRCLRVYSGGIDGDWGPRSSEALARLDQSIREYPNQVSRDLERVGDFVERSKRSQ